MGRGRAGFRRAVPEERLSAPRRDAEPPSCAAEPLRGAGATRGPESVAALGILRTVGAERRSSRVEGTFPRLEPCGEPAPCALRPAGSDGAASPRRTCLHWACKRSHAPVVALLLDAGADRRIPTGAGQLAEQLTAKAHIRRILGGTVPSSRSWRASSARCARAAPGRAVSIP